MDLGSTSSPPQPDHHGRGPSRAAGTLAVVVVLVATGAWLTGLYLAIRWLVTAVF